MLRDASVPQKQGIRDWSLGSTNGWDQVSHTHCTLGPQSCILEVSMNSPNNGMRTSCVELTKSWLCLYTLLYEPVKRLSGIIFPNVLYLISALILNLTPE